MYRLNDEQNRIVADAAAVADAQIGPQAASVDQNAAFPRQSIAALGQRGLLGRPCRQHMAASARVCARWSRFSTWWRSAARRRRWCT